MVRKIMVAGGTGRTGRLIVMKLIAEGHYPNVLVRDPARAKQILGEEPVFFKGNVCQTETLLPAMLDMEIVISAIGARTPVGKSCPQRIDYNGVVNLVTAACQARIQHFILVSSIAVTHPEHPLNRFGRVLDWKRKGEEALIESGLVYTIIRPGALMDTPGGRRQLIFAQGDHVLGTVSRADVAEACLQALNYPASQGATFELVEIKNSGRPDWDGLFRSLT
jgi:uncharacterized protein YbjT (DUF2867 family)